MLGLDEVMTVLVSIEARLVQIQREIREIEGKGTRITEARRLAGRASAAARREKNGSAQPNKTRTKPSRTKQGVPGTNPRTKLEQNSLEQNSTRQAPIPRPERIDAEWIRSLLPKPRWYEIAKLYDNDEAYLEDESRRMAIWLDANRQKALKTPRGWNSFITGWLNRSWDNYSKTREAPKLKVDHDAMWKR